MQINTPIGSPSGDVSYDLRPCIPRHNRHKRAFGTPGHNRRWQRQGLLRALGGLAAIEHTALHMYWGIPRGKCSLLVGPECAGGDGCIVLGFWCDSHWVG